MRRRDRLRALADAHRRVETARTPEALADALADREAIESGLLPLSCQDCAVIDQRLFALRALDRGERRAA